MSVVVLLAIAPVFPDRCLAAGDEEARVEIERVLERPGSGSPSVLEEHRVQAALHTVYTRRGNVPLWSKDGRPTPQAAALRGELSAADARGLDPADYRIGIVPATTGARAASDAWGLYDVSLSAAVLRFLVDLHYGRVDSVRAGFQLHAAQPPLDLAAVLKKLSVTSDVGTTLTAAEPQFYHYRLLEQSLKQYRRLALLQAGLPPLPEAPERPVRIGEAYSGVPAVRALLRLRGDLPAGDPVGDGRTSLDPALAAALKHFQSRHGLPADGGIGRATYAALATPLTQRVRQIELTLERWRWLPAFDTPPIIVNIPQFRLFAFRSTADLKRAAEPRGHRCLPGSNRR